MDAVKVVMLGVVGVLVALQFRGGKQEYGICIGIGVSLMIFFHICEYLGQVKTEIRVLENLFDGNGEYLGILLKVTGIAYLSELGASLCRDAGYQSVAAQVELFGKVTILAAGLPVMLALAETIAGFAV